MEKQNALSEGEWKLMNLLWQAPPHTVPELVDALADDTGWSKGTVFTMLARLEEKGAVSIEARGRNKFYYPAIKREQAARRETKSFLDRVYSGSLGLMVNSMVSCEQLTADELEELRGILDRAEKEAKDD